MWTHRWNKKYILEAHFYKARIIEIAIYLERYLVYTLKGRLLIYDLRIQGLKTFDALFIPLGRDDSKHWTTLQIL